ncbi:MAG: PAS domain-containing protein [Candidatus Obscuribacterales bacterium]|nr:PAS domain-containing protein [Candidatus Obscuribacterales bacterium]
MNLLRFKALAEIVSAVRKYKCRASDFQSRADELSQLLVNEFLVDGEPALNSARLLFVPCEKVTDSSERAVLTETEISQLSNRSKKSAASKGTVMYLEPGGMESFASDVDTSKSSAKLDSSGMDNRLDVQKDSFSNGAKVVATIRTSEEFQFVVTLEMTVELAPDVVPYFRVLSSMLASKITGNDSFAKDLSDEWADLYELTFAEISNSDSPEFRVVERSRKTEASPASYGAAEDADHFSEWSHSLAESLPLIVWTALPDGAVNFVNSKWTDYTGLTAKDAYGAGWQRALHPADFERAVQHFEESLQTGELYESEHRLLDLNTRQYRWFLVQGVPVRDREGKIKIWFGTATDIDEQKRVHERLRIVMDTIPAAIFWKDREGVYLGGNKTFAEIAGFSDADQIIGKTDYDMPWTSEETKFYHLCDRKVMDENRPQFNIIEPLTKKSGEIAWLSTSKMPMHDAAGNVVGVLAHFEDITKTVQLQSQREDFMASLAHDLKVPVIGAIRALDALLQGYVGPLDSKQIEFIQCLHRSHENLLLMVKNLLQVLRFESGKDQFIFEHFDFVGILNEMLKNAGPTIEAKHLDVNFHAPEKLVLHADRSAIKALVINLIGNALSSAPEYTHVKIDLQIVERQAVLEVHSGGEPISEEDMEQLFQRLWQGKRFGAGAGLGLFLCRQIAEGHGGSMSCRSSRKEGTIMRFAIPIDQDSQDQRKQKKQSKIR